MHQDVIPYNSVLRPLESLVQTWHPCATQHSGAWLWCGDTEVQLMKPQLDRNSNCLQCTKGTNRTGRRYKQNRTMLTWKTWHFWKVQVERTLFQCERRIFLGKHIFHSNPSHWSQGTQPRRAKKATEIAVRSLESCWNIDLAVLNDAQVCSSKTHETPKFQRQSQRTEICCLRVMLSRRQVVICGYCTGQGKNPCSLRAKDSTWCVFVIAFFNGIHPHTRTLFLLEAIGLFSSCSLSISWT